MIYQNIKKAVFLNRPNRFIAMILIEGIEEVCHVKNTGRCKELLLANADILVEECISDSRKTKYDLIAVWKGNRLINMDSSAPNKVFFEWLQQSSFFKDIRFIKPESRFGNSRFDFYVEETNRRSYIEVKGVTLEENGIARFPDAPTERGVKHLNELIACKESGFDAYMVFIIQMKGVHHMEPNSKTHQAFTNALKDAKNAGVYILALDCFVTENSLAIADQVKVIL